jgi:hypothetical protein
MSQENYGADRERGVSVGDWIFTIIISSIPFLGIIALLLWAFGSSTPLCKSNWAKAWLFLQILGYLAAILFWGTVVSVLAL